MEEYVYDLENTWTLNTEMLTTILYDFSMFSLDQKTKLSSIVEKIKELFIKKKIFRDEKYKLRGKLLMDKQILEEFKRRNEENSVYYSEQIDEYKENLDKKDSFIKQFEKKFNEVEIYVQREAKSNASKWNKFIDFEILSFINENENMQEKKTKTIEEIKNIEEDIKEILKENVELKKRDEFIDISDEYDSKKSKYKSLIKVYKAKIKFMERNAEHLRSVLNKLNNKLDNIANFNNTLNFKLKVKDPEKMECPTKVDTSNYDTFNINRYKSEKLKENVSIEEDNMEANMEISIGDSEEIDSSGEEKKEENIIGNKNKSHDELFIKRNYSLVEEPSVIRTPEFTLKQENWDISCIENFNDN